jgi:hypothetical protein
MDFKGHFAMSAAIRRRRLMITRAQRRAGGLRQ